jgi:hypothetical protein
MRLILSLCLVSGVASVAGAHTIASDVGLLSQLGHQLLGLHHLPLTAILVFGGIVLFRQLHRTIRRDNKRPQ